MRRLAIRVNHKERTEKRNPKDHVSVSWYDQKRNIGEQENEAAQIVVSTQQMIEDIILLLF